MLLVCLLSACGKQAEKMKVKTTSKISSSETIEELSDKKDAMDGDVQSKITTIKSSENVSVKAKTSSVADVSGNNQNESPMILSLSLEEIKTIKTAFEAMPADEFMTYMENEHKEEYMTGLWDYENSQKLLSEICETSIPVVDSASTDIKSLSFHWEINTIMQVIAFDSGERFSVMIETPSSESEKELNIGEETEIVLLKEIENEEYSAKFYEADGDYYPFYVCVTVDESFIILRTVDIETQGSLEDCFSRLSFAKVGDLIEQGDAE